MTENQLPELPEADDAGHEVMRRRAEAQTSIRFFLRKIRPLLEEDGITEIAFNDPNTHTIFVEKFGRWEERSFEVEPQKSEVTARTAAVEAAIAGYLRQKQMTAGGAHAVVHEEKKPSWEETTQLNRSTIESLARAVAAYNNDDFSDTKPILSATLPDGERCQFVCPPACLKGRISMTIRRPSMEVREIENYIRQGFFDSIHPVTNERPGDAELLSLYDKINREDLPLETLRDARSRFLTRAVELGRTIVIAGGTGSGKTTFMKALMQSIPTSERIITIEDCPELVYGLPHHHNQVNLLYASEATDISPVNAASLMKSCLRMKPDRILLAELRSGETYDWLNSVLSGHSGSITSCHANNTTAVFDYLALKVLQSPTGKNLPYPEIDRLLRDVIDIVVHIQNNHGERHITEVYFKAAKEREAAAGT